MTIFTFLTLAVAESAKVAEPILSWSFLFGAVLVPFSLWISYTAINRKLNKKDKEEHDKDAIIKKLVEQREEFKDREDNHAHQLINNSIESLHKEVVDECRVSKESRDVIFDKLSKMEVTLKLINGSVRDTKKDLEVHIAKTE